MNGLINKREYRIMKHSSVKAKRAISFITINEEKKFSIQPEGAKLFESQSNPFGVIAVIGPKRSFKSTLLNELIDEKTAFQVTSNERANTKGIWVYRIVCIGLL